MIGLTIGSLLLAPRELAVTALNLGTRDSSQLMDGLLARLPQIQAQPDADTPEATEPLRDQNGITRKGEEGEKVPAGAVMGERKSPDRRAVAGNSKRCHLYVDWE
jgi:hypothetical protein